jgi:CHAT domain-containing protein
LIAAVPMTRRTSIGLLVGGSVLLLGVTGVWWSRATGTRSTSEPYAQLLVAVGSTRPVEGRLTGGLRHVPWRSTRGPSPVREADVAVDLRIAGATVEKRFIDDPSPEHQAQAGVARLLVGDANGAVTLLERAVLTRPTSHALSDLSAAYLARSRARSSAEDTVRALDTALRAIEGDELLPEAWFNAALTMEVLNLREPARGAWLTAARLEHDREWQREAGDRATVVRAPLREDRVTALGNQLASAEALSDGALQREPDIVREVLERVVLTQWAGAVLAGRDDDQQRWMRKAVAIATPLSALTTDAQPAESVRLLRTACLVASPNCRRTAAAYKAYADGRDAWDAERTTEAYRAFEAAGPGLAAAGHPEAGWVAVHESLREYYAGRFNAARARAVPVLADARRRGYVALASRLNWLIGLLYNEQGQFAVALEYYRPALEGFERCRDRESQGAVHTLLGDYYRLLGEPAKGWEHQIQTLALLPAARRYKRQPFLSDSARLASSSGLLRAAVAFNRESAREMRLLGATASLAQTLSEEAGDLARLGRRDDALRTIDEAQTALAQTSDPDLVALVGATVDIERANVLKTLAPARSAEALSRAIDFYGRHGSEFDLPGLLLARGRALAATGRVAEAEVDWRQGITVASTQRRRATSDAQRVELHSARWDLYSALAELRVQQQHDPTGALELLEQGRGVNLGERVAPRSGQAEPPIVALGSRLPRGTLALVYATLPARTYLWALDTTGVQYFSIEHSLEDIDGKVRAYRDAIQDRDDAARCVELSSQLFDLLLGPVRSQLRHASRLVVVPDGPLHDIPFGSLRDRVSGAFVIERASVLVTPSLRFALGAGTGPRLLAGGDAAALVVGNPARRPEDANLPSLPGSAREAELVSDRYPRHVFLSGADATRDRFLAAVPAASVVHFAGHAVANRDRPELSRLVLAPAPGDALGALFVYELEGVRLPRTRLVVLAACETARGAAVKGEGVLGLVRGFLGAGVPAVVATLWHIDDRLSPPLFQAFHASWARGHDAPAALREAQLALLRDRSLHASIADWAAPIVVGRDIR